MRRLILSLTVAALAVSCLGCSRSAHVPIVVHVFRDPSVSEIDSALRAAGKTQLALADRPIVIATVEYTSYSDGLAVLGQRTHPEVVFLNSVADGERFNIDLPPQSAFRILSRAYYIAIPPWAKGVERQAAEVVVASVRQELKQVEH